MKHVLLNVHDDVMLNPINEQSNTTAIEFNRTLIDVNVNDNVKKWR